MEVCRAHRSFRMARSSNYSLERPERTGDRSFLNPPLLALTQMIRGGIHDHVGGGFARYSVDERWHVPHFEKMLYDNAQILELLAKAYACTKDFEYRIAAESIVGWLQEK